ncbi:uncharacterized protein LOC132742991 [Ruditapes philippinarum]|uniref:uncharacterized protein LOC132742991 n=1 Tax=Ruditapes philippinarum TaxID=129788 RepID=UPI00295AB3BF|nr:uncharacterized protein LOC132742991 [Ruditapes philippinarum]
MEQGVCYTYKAAAYPRYRFYQQHLQRLCNRWQNILDAGSLPDCVSRGRIRLKEILSLSKQIEDTVTVNVYADHDFLETSKLLLQCDQKVSGQVGSVSWKSFMEGSVKSSEITVTVIVLRSKEENAISNLKKQLSGVSKEEIRKVIIHFVDTQTSIPYNNVVDKKLHQPDVVDSVTDKTRVLSLPLNQQIQHLLEESVIFVLERIAEYNKEFILKKQEHQASDALENAIFTGLMKSMRNTFVVKDLSPDENDKPDEGLKKATDKQLSRLASGIGSNWELLGPSLGVTAMELDHIKSEHKTVAQQCYHMLILWRQKEGSSLTYILQLLKNLSKVIAVDMNVVKEIEADKPVPSTASDKDKIFHKKLLDFVSKKTKCVVCDNFFEKEPLT